MNDYQILTGGYWIATHDGDPAAFEIFKRHYSYHCYRDSRRVNSRNRKLIIGPGQKMVLILPNHKALFAWRKFIDASGQTGVNCSVFRNESDILSSTLILEAEILAWKVWPGERLYTYVNGSVVHGDGNCFKHAGWRKLNKRTKSGLIILEKLPNERAG